jgi:putative endonuclease
MASQQEWYVYIIRTSGGQLYTGITTDLERRFAEHQESPKGAKFFSISEPEKIVFQERHPDRSTATRREAEIKRMTRQEKLRLFQVSGVENST